MAFPLQTYEAINLNCHCFRPSAISVPVYTGVRWYVLSMYSFYIGLIAVLSRLPFSRILFFKYDELIIIHFFTGSYSMAAAELELGNSGFSVRRSTICAISPGMADHRFTNVSLFTNVFLGEIIFFPLIFVFCFSGLLDSWDVSGSTPTEFCL